MFCNLRYSTLSLSGFKIIALVEKNNKELLHQYSFQKSTLQKSEGQKIAVIIKSLVNYIAIKSYKQLMNLAVIIGCVSYYYNRGKNYL